MKKRKILIAVILSLGFTILLLGFTIMKFYKRSSHQEMIQILQDLNKRNLNVENPFNPEVKKAYIDSMIKTPYYQLHSISLRPAQAALGLKTGQEEQSVKIYEDLVKQMDFMSIDNLMPDIGIAYMRLGERSNCMLNHNGSSCIFPIKDGGVHKIKTGSTKAIGVYESILKNHPDDYESKWLLNVAFMTLGGYPENVPAQFLIPGLDSDTAYKVKPFTDIAADLGLDINGRAGGVIVDDFNNDGYLDIVTSGWGLDDPMHYFQNNKDGSFTDLTERSGLKASIN